MAKNAVPAVNWMFAAFLAWPKAWRVLFGMTLIMMLLLCALDFAFPLPAQTRSAPDDTLVVLAEDGSVLRSWPGTDGALRYTVELGAVSPSYIEALLQYEDRWFYWHPGVNPVALIRAGWQWLRLGRIVSGGSTLTMQVARILDAPNVASGTRSLKSKLCQIARALQLEAHLSKREILTLYLNHAPMGGQVQGVEMASLAYLGKSARELSRADAALLVALPQTPSRLRPDRAPGLAQSARDKVLQRMRTSGAWSAASVADAELERVFAPPLRARWLAPLAAQRLRNGAAPGSSIMRSTLDAGMQTRVEQVLLDRLAGLPSQVSIAALVVENQNLAVRAYAGSADFNDPLRSAHVDMVRAVRSPGSTLKPFLYAMALDDGLVHSESLLLDTPQNFGGYSPGNFQAAFSGPVSVSEALQRSLNVPAVDLLERVGPARFAAQLRNAGLKLRMADGALPNLSLILGGGGTTLEELVGAYTALARGGMAGLPRLTPGQALTEVRLMSPGAAFIVREILENGGRPDAPFVESRARVAWKTGTSFGFRDAWAIGVTDRYTVGIWVGRPDGTPNPGYFGANTSAPLLRDLMSALDAEPGAARAVPPQVRAVDICWPLGLAATATAPAHCLVRRSAWTLDGTAPPTLPDRVRDAGLLETAWIDSVHQQRLRPGCAREPRETGINQGTKPIPLIQSVQYARWPALLEPWIAPAQRSAVELLPLAAGCALDSPRRALRVSGIDPGSVIRARPGNSSATVQVQAIGSREAVHWLLDGQWVGSTTPSAASMRLRLTQSGEHTLTATDDQGRYDQVRFTVQ